MQTQIRLLPIPSFRNNNNKRKINDLMSSLMLSNINNQPAEVSAA